MDMTVFAADHAIGVILPSSNRVVERVTRTIVEGFPGVDACFSRVPYGGQPDDSYDDAAFMSAAGMLAQARPGIIVWNATRGALIGFEPDHRLCAMIERETGVPATTTSLETIGLFRSRGIRRIAILQQGDQLEGLRLEKNFAGQGVEIVARRDLDIRDNFDAASVDIADMTRFVHELAESRPDGILIWSTNLRGHALAETLTSRLGIPVFDSAAIGILSAIGRLGISGGYFNREPGDTALVMAGST